MMFLRIIIQQSMGTHINRSSTVIVLIFKCTHFSVYSYKAAWDQWKENSFSSGIDPFSQYFGIIVYVYVFSSTIQTAKPHLKSQNAKISIR